MIDESLRFALPGTALLGAVAGGVGTLAVVRRQGLQGDAIAHAALPGVGIAFLLGAREASGIAFGAAVVAWLAMLAVRGLQRTTRLSFDTLLGGTLAVFFAIGVALLDRIRRRPGGAANSLDHFLFGQAALMNAEDLRVIALVGIAALVLMIAFWKQFQLMAFDADYAAVIGVPTAIFDALYTLLLVAAVVAGLQAVGVVLMSALIVAPAVAARPWMDRLAPLAMLAAILGALAGLSGTLIAHRLALPTGPAIVLAATAFAAISLLARWRR